MDSKHNSRTIDNESRASAAEAASLSRLQMHQQLHASRAKITLPDDDSLHQHLAGESRLKLLKPIEAKVAGSSEEDEEPRRDDEDEEEEDEEVDEQIRQYQDRFNKQYEIEQMEI